MPKNDKLKVTWKTNCKWRDVEHSARRKEIKLTDVNIGKEEFATLPIRNVPTIRNVPNQKVKAGSTPLKLKVLNKEDKNGDCASASSTEEQLHLKMIECGKLSLKICELE